MQNCILTIENKAIVWAGQWKDKWGGRGAEDRSENRTTAKSICPIPTEAEGERYRRTGLAGEQVEN